VDLTLAARRVDTITGEMLALYETLGPWPEALTCAANACTILRDLGEQLHEDAVGRPLGRPELLLPHTYRTGNCNLRNVYLRLPGGEDAHVAVVFNPQFGPVAAQALTDYALRHGGELPVSGLCAA
jgi:hypothetical protein